MEHSRGMLSIIASPFIVRHGLTTVGCSGNCRANFFSDGIKANRITYIINCLLHYSSGGLIAPLLELGWGGNFQVITQYILTHILDI